MCSSSPQDPSDTEAELLKVWSPDTENISMMLAATKGLRENGDRVTLFP
jgi:hypothetical protein